MSVADVPAAEATIDHTEKSAPQIYLETPSPFFICANSVCRKPLQVFTPVDTLGNSFPGMDRFPNPKKICQRCQVRKRLTGPRMQPPGWAIEFSDVVRTNCTVWEFPSIQYLWKEGQYPDKVILGEILCAFRKKISPSKPTECFSGFLLLIVII